MSKRESIESLNAVRRGGEQASQYDFRLGTAPQDSEDIGSESVIVALKTEADLDAPFPFGRVTGLRTKTDLLRRMYVERKYIELSKLHYEEAIDDNPQDCAIRDETKIKVWEALSKLSQRNLVYIISKYILEQQLVQTALIVNQWTGEAVAAPTHRTRMFHAREALRPHLDNE